MATKKVPLSKKTAKKTIKLKGGPASTRALKAASVWKPAIFNHKNVLKFADRIFSDKNGIVSFVKLCDDRLFTKTNSPQLHCAVGEAYYHFVSNKLTRLSRDPFPTDKAITSLVKAAVLKEGTNADQLARALREAMDTNDSILHYDSDSCAAEDEHYFSRAQEVARVFRTVVAPLLK